MAISDQGNLDTRYHFVLRTLVFLFKDEQVLLIKGAPHKRLWANLYNGLGGHVERGEDIYHAAHRELSEETGIVGVNLWLCGLITIDAGQEAGITIFIFRGDSETDQVKPSMEGNLEWVAIERLGQIPLVEDLPILLPRIIQMHHGDMPFSAHYQALPGHPFKVIFFHSP